MRRTLASLGFMGVMLAGVCDDSPTGADCDPSYPDVCIPSPPPDLNCDDISFRNFRVVGSDPHGFDTDDDGIGCEEG